MHMRQMSKSSNKALADSCVQLPVTLTSGLTAEKQSNKAEAGYDMRCALMNLTLPMESLAHQLLQ